MAKTEHDMLDDMALEAFFEAGRAKPPQPSQDLMARIMADAVAEMPAPRPIARPVTPPARKPVRKPGLLAGLIAGIGGWPALAGMATATVAGVWIGFAQPDTLNTWAGGALLSTSDTATSYDLEDLVPSYGSFDTLLEEG